MSEKVLPDNKGKALIRVRIAKSRLYEARVGIIDLQKRWDKPGLGTRNQSLVSQVMN